MKAMRNIALILSALMWWPAEGANIPVFPDTGQVFLVATKNVFTDSSIFTERHHWHIVYNLDNVFIARSADDTLPETVYFTQTRPLVRPIDSLLSLYFKTSRSNNKAAFYIQMHDTCVIRPALKFRFRPLPTPLKEINIFSFPGLVQDEFYFDISLEKVKVKDRMAEFLFFEYLLQKFFNKKILPDKIYTEPVLAALATAYRPIYAPEIHFYLESKAADEVIKKWEKIKKSFKKSLKENNLQSDFRMFMREWHLINGSAHARIVVWTKLMQRYGYQKNMKALFKDKMAMTPEMKKHLLEFADHVQLIWFRSSEVDEDILRALRRQNLEGGFRIFVD